MPAKDGEALSEASPGGGRMSVAHLQTLSMSTCGWAKAGDQLLVDTQILDEPQNKTALASLMATLTATGLIPLLSAWRIASN